jgi:hypothetical protein
MGSGRRSDLKLTEAPKIRVAAPAGDHFELAGQNDSWYKTSCLLVNKRAALKTQAKVWVFF